MYLIKSFMSFKMQFWERDFGLLTVFLSFIPLNAINVTQCSLLEKFILVLGKRQKNNFRYVAINEWKTSFKT